MAAGGAASEAIGVPERTGTRLRFSSLLLAAFVMMAVCLLYVWSHVEMRRLEYRLAEELHRRDLLLEEQRRLRLECATLKAPQRIEAIAREKLMMSHPAQDQVIILKWSEGQ